LHRVQEESAFEAPRWYSWRPRPSACTPSALAGRATALPRCSD